MAQTNSRVRGRLILFLNVLLAIFVAMDLVAILLMAPQDPHRFSLHNDNLSFNECASCPKPDVYFLLCDELASTKSLNETWHYDNGWFDSTLRQRGFQVITSSSSNYNFTPFSVASILNMDYISGPDATGSVGIDDYQRCNALIRNNRVVSFFRANGYEIRNYSIFDLDGNPSPLHQGFLPLKTRMITEQTLLNRFNRDLGHLFVYGRWRVGWLAGLFFAGNYDSDALLTRVVQESATAAPAPRFFYTHLYMPHTPYLYDSAGKRRSDSLVLLDYRKPAVEPYLGSVAYSSRRLAGAVDSIIRQSARPPVIILMGDHGFRMQEPSTGRKDFFRNMNAVYLPRGTLARLPDSLTTVNQFRVLLNSLYGQQLPLLKDSIILLTDK